MSMEPSFLPEGRSLNPSADRWTADPGSGEAWGIRRQAARIIAMVLADSAPEEARARQHLRKCLAARPGRPEIALAEHLSALRLEAAGGPPLDVLPSQQHAAGDKEPAEPALPAVAQLPEPRPDVRRPVLHHHPTLKARYGRPGPALGQAVQISATTAKWSTAGKGS
jgi:hypothetical protein